MLRERSQDGTTGTTGVRDKPKILLRLSPGPVQRLAPMTRDFHPGPELLAAPHRGRRYECSLSDPAPALSRAADAASVACEVFLRPPIRVRRRAFHSASAAVPGPRLEIPARQCLPHPAADGILRFQTPPRPPHSHREPVGKTRPASRPPPAGPPPTSSRGLTEESRYEGSGGRDSPRPDPSLRSG